jgi:hypothetical protein
MTSLGIVRRKIQQRYFGKFLADLDAEGMSPYGFLRIRVEIPVDRRLRPSITTQVKGKSETYTYLLRYERVPFFFASGVAVLAMIRQSVRSSVLAFRPWATTQGCDVLLYANLNVTKHMFHPSTIHTHRSERN